MRVKLKTTYAGPLGAFSAGSTVDLTEEQAEALIPDYAGPVAVKAIETATMEQAETAVTVKPKRSRNA